MRGLACFITDVRQCKGKNAELKRINKELAKIRSKFKGHKCDFGLKEAINLLSSNSYCDKQGGYLFISVVAENECYLMPLVINALKNDLSSSKDVFQNLALQFIANNSSLKLADSVAHPVMKLLSSSVTTDYVRQSAILALLQLLRVKSDLMVSDTTVSLISNLICHPDLGLVTASASLIEFLVKKSPSQYGCCMAQCIIKLNKIISSSFIELRDYGYYFVEAPWISVKLLEILHNFPAPTDASLNSTLKDSLRMILKRASDIIRTRKLFEHNNAKYAVLFEAISLIVHMEIGEPILSQAFRILETTLQSKEINLRFMALEMMVQLSNYGMYVEQAKSQLGAVLKLLKGESDITIKKRAADFLYSICSVHNVKRIVDEMLNLLEDEYNFSEDVMLQTAALAEQFGKDKEWYIDTVLNLLQLCGDKMSDSIWHSLVKVVTENNSLQEYAAKASYAVLCERDCHDAVIKLAGYILGEFGYLITSDPRSICKLQFNVLKEKYHKCSNSTKALLLTIFMKFLNIYPSMKDEVQFILKDACNIQNEDEEIQQRAVEYLKLSEIAFGSLLVTVFQEMPSNERKISPTVTAIQNKKSKCFSMRRVENRPNGNNLKVFRSHDNLKNVVENINEVCRVNSVSQSNFTYVAFPNNRNSLLDIFQDTPTVDIFSKSLQRMLMPTLRMPSISNNQSFLYNLLFNEKGKLYENDLIAITVECEFSKHWGRFHLKYMNKTANEFWDFSLQKNASDIQNKCSIWFKPCNSKLSPIGIVEQDIHLECLSEFSERPSLKLTFLSENQYNEIKLILPLTLNKFVEPCNMTPSVFTERYKKLESFNNLKVVKEFAAKYSMMHGAIQEKLEGFRLAVIDKMNCDIEHFRCAGIFYTRERRVGFLLRLEMNMLDNKYCCKVMSSHLNLSHVISNLLCELL